MRSRPNLRRFKQAAALGAMIFLACWLAACGAQAPAAQPTPRLPTAAIAARPTPRPTSTPIPTDTPAPTPTPAPATWRFVVLGDTRTEGLKPPGVTYDIVERAAEARPDMVLVVGDMINALNTQSEVREQWRNWRAAVAPLGGNGSQASPWLLVTPGNHDVQGNAWATDLLVEAFPELPENGPPGFERRAYSVDYQGVRFISLDSERISELHRLGDAQLAWLEARLRDNTSRYTIVFSHDPAYPVGPHAGSSLDVYPAERDRFWKLLREHNVTAYVAGHEHLYNHQVIDGVDQIIAGTSGSFVYSGYGGEFYHYVVGEVDAQGLTFIVYDQSGTERDRYTLAPSS